MLITVKKGCKTFSVAPSHISELATFIVDNINTNSLVYEFCYIIDKWSTKKEFDNYNINFLPQTDLERNLMELLDIFYIEADRLNNVDNERGVLLENIVYQISLRGKYISHIKWFGAILDILDKKVKCLFSTDPHNFDFFFEEKDQNNGAAIDCKVKVFKDKKQLKTFDNFATEVENYGLNYVIGVVHLIRERAWIVNYKTWYQKLIFIGPDEFQKELF